MPPVRRYEFTVDFEGIEYACLREVTSDITPTQVITVEGIGSKQDGRYGRRGRPVSSMERVAVLIAQEILQERK
jgi:hypothetical protein